MQQISPKMAHLYNLGHPHRSLGYFVVIRVGKNSIRKKTAEISPGPPKPQWGAWTQMSWFITLGGLFLAAKSTIYQVYLVYLC